MKFSKELLNQYRKYQQETNIQECYQEVIKMFKEFRAVLEREMKEFSFTGKIAENQMDFAYFQATTPELKKLGLKIQVVFVHKFCQLEVWVSGYNRGIQRAYHEQLQSLNCPYELCENPERTDYIVRVPVEKGIGEDEFQGILEEIKERMEAYKAYFEKRKVQEQA